MLTIATFSPFIQVEILPFIVVVSRRRFLLKMATGRCFTFSLSPIFAIKSSTWRFMEFVFPLYLFLAI